MRVIFLIFVSLSVSFCFKVAFQDYFINGTWFTTDSYGNLVNVTYCDHNFTTRVMCDSHVKRVNDGWFNYPAAINYNNSFLDCLRERVFDLTANCSSNMFGYTMIPFGVRVYNNTGWKYIPGFFDLETKVGTSFYCNILNCSEVLSPSYRGDFSGFSTQYRKDACTASDSVPHIFREQTPYGPVDGYSIYNASDKSVLILVPGKPGAGSKLSYVSGDLPCLDFSSVNTSQCSNFRVGSSVYVVQPYLLNDSYSFINETVLDITGKPLYTRLGNKTYALLNCNATILPNKVLYHNGTPKAVGFNIGGGSGYPYGKVFSYQESLVSLADYQSATEIDCDCCDYRIDVQHCLCNGHLCKGVGLSILSNKPKAVGNFTMPTQFILNIESEYFQFYDNATVIVCEVFICGFDPFCLDVLQEFGGFCDGYRQNLYDIRMSGDRFVSDLSVLVNSTTMGFVTQNSQPNVVSNYVDSVLDSFESSVGFKTGRSFVEDLLFDSHEASSITEHCGYYFGSLAKPCHFGNFYVLEPVMDEPERIVQIILNVLFPLWAQAANLDRVNARLNSLGLTVGKLVENQKVISQGFNKLILDVSKGFKAIANSLNKIEGAVNGLVKSFNQLIVEFDQFSFLMQSKLIEIEKRGLMSNYIGGRIALLNIYMSQLRFNQARVESMRDLFLMKVRECILGVTTRHGFCGAGVHSFSVLKPVELGALMIHFNLVGSEFINVTVYGAFCSNFQTFLPRNGIFVACNTSVCITSPELYDPRELSMHDVFVLDGCNYNYSSVVHRVLLLSQLDNNTDLQEVIRNVNLLSLQFSSVSNLSLEVLDLKEEVALFSDLSHSILGYTLNLEEMFTYRVYSKWPWWVWLIISIVWTIFFLLILMCCCFTGCCGICGCIARSARKRLDVEGGHFKYD